MDPITLLGDVKCQMIKTDEIYPDGCYTAVCNSMGTFGQGKTPEIAIKKLCEATTNAIKYIFDKIDNTEDEVND